ncbi:MAG: hypothetical protein GY788_08265 [bacterium]|nr:hypothetical protein [bacterium]
MTELAAVVAAILLGAIALFQLAVAAGAPWGDMAWGGRHDRRLPMRLRVGSAVAAAVLVMAATVVLAQGGVISWTPVPEGALRTVTWVLAGFMVINTIGNLASASRMERRVFGPATAVLAVLIAVVAISGEGPV